MSNRADTLTARRARERPTWMKGWLRGETALAWLFILPSLIGFTLFYAYPAVRGVAAQLHRLGSAQYAALCRVLQLPEAVRRLAVLAGAGRDALLRGAQHSAPDGAGGRPGGADGPADPVDHCARHPGAALADPERGGRPALAVDARPAAWDRQPVPGAVRHPAPAVRRTRSAGPCRRSPASTSGGTSATPRC